MKPPNIKIINQDLPANFVSEFHCFHTPNEFTINMIEVIPQMGYQLIDGINPLTKQKQKMNKIVNDGILQKIVGRVAMSPASFKKLVNVLNQNLQKYEDKFGEIAINQPEHLQ